MAIAYPSRTNSISQIRVRKIGMQDLRIALAQGWQDFLSKRGDLLFIGVIYPAGVLLGVTYAYRISIIPLVFPLLSGSILLGPAVASGFYELARRREQGLDSRWRHFWDVLRSNTAVSLAALTSVLAFIFMLWIAAAWIIYSYTLGPQHLHTVPTFLHAVFTTPVGWTMIIVGNLVGLAFAIWALAISVVSFPMLVDRPVGWEVAMRTSLEVFRVNRFTILAWGLIVVGLLILGSIPFFVGLAVVLPVLGYATWHLYTLAVER